VLEEEVTDLLGRGKSERRAVVDAPAGYSQGDFELALRGLLGDGAPLSASSIERLRAKWQLEFPQKPAGRTVFRYTSTADAER
jgi:hypothetical protein